jgi:DNA-binding MarR family transcriptional regulator
MEEDPTFRTDHASARVVDLLQKLLRFQPRLVFPDQRLANLQKQLRAIRQTSRGKPEERAFLFRILFALRYRENPPTMGELSSELGIPLSSATRMADGLVRARLVERSTDPKDRRVVRLRVTEGGSDFLETAEKYMKERVDQLLGHFTPQEQEQLIRLLGKLVDSLQAERQ